MKSIPRSVSWVLALVGLLLVVVVVHWVHTARQSWVELQAAQACEAALDYPCAALRFRHALELYAPLGSASAQGLAGLTRIARAQERRGEAEGALLALRSARIGILAIRHVLVPFEARLEDLERNIAVLAVAPDQAEAHARELEAARMALPSARLSLALAGGLLGFLMLGLWLARRR